MLENFIMHVRRPKGVLGERIAFVSREAQASAAAYTILKLNDFTCFFVVCLFRVIEELVRTTALKFGMRVDDAVARNKF